MNRLLSNQLNTDFPEKVEVSLEYGYATVSAFNRKGNLLAVGCSDGLVVLWDFQAKSVAKYFKGQHTARINSVQWSRNNRQLLTASVDGTVLLIDVLTEKVAERHEFEAPVASACFSEKFPKDLFLVSVAGNKQEAPSVVLVHRRDGNQTLQSLPSAETLLGSSTADEDSSEMKGLQEGEVLVTACFGKGGRKGDEEIIAGGSMGSIVVYSTLGVTSTGSRDAFTLQRCFRTTTASSPSVKQLAISRDGKFLLANIKPRGSGGSLIAYDMSAGYVRLLELSDAVNKTPWGCMTFSHNAEYIIAAAADSNSHSLYVWQLHSGKLETVLNAPKEMILHICYHPTRPILTECSVSGLVYVWTKTQQEDWSAFATDFYPLLENTEYMEREDEFDAEHIVQINEEHHAMMSRYNDLEKEEEPVDVVTVEAVAQGDFSTDDEDDLPFLLCKPGVNEDFVKAWETKMAEGKDMEAALKAYKIEEHAHAARVAELKNDLKQQRKADADQLAADLKETASKAKQAEAARREAVKMEKRQAEHTRKIEWLAEKEAERERNRAEVERGKRRITLPDKLMGEVEGVSRNSDKKTRLN